MGLGDIVTITHGEGPLIAAALHNGHAVRDEVGRLLSLSVQERLREEDPFTAPLTLVAPSRIIGHRSRFEIDLNRPRDKAVYRHPEDAWGLVVWKSAIPDEMLQESLRYYDLFYETVEELFRKKSERHGTFVVYDIHSYNHFRAGRESSPDDPAANPEINVGTGTMDRRKWSRIVDRFISDLRTFDFDGRSLDVRENIRFRGGEFPRWTHATFPDSGCVLAIEVKKFFMDEWTGELDRKTHALLKQALASTVPGVLEEVARR